MSDNRGGISWFVRLLLDKASSKKVEQDLKQSGAKAGADMGGGVETGVKKSLDGVLRYVKGIFGLEFARAIASSLRSAGQAINGFVQKGAELDRLRTSFDSITASAGISGRAMLAAMKEASRGMVADLELMRQANFALQVGLPVTAESMGELVYISRRLAEATGRDATEAFQRLVQGIAKGEVEILEELGLLTRMETATNAWSKANGRSVESMTQQEKVLAFFNTVVDEARGKISGLGKDTLDAGERISQVTTFWENLQSAVALAVLDSPRIATFFENMGVGAEDAGRKVEDLANKVGAFVDTYGAQALGAIVSAGQGALAGGAAGLAVGIMGGPLGMGSGSVLGALIGARRGFINNRPDSTYAENLARRQAAADLERQNEGILALINGGRSRKGGNPEIPLTTEQIARLAKEAKEAEARVAALWRRLDEWTGATEFSVIGNDGKEVTHRLNNLSGRIPRRDPGDALEVDKKGRATGMAGLPAGAGERVAAVRAERDEYLSLMASIPDVAEHASYEMASAFEDAFNRMREDGATTRNFLDGIWRGLAGSMLQGLAEFARGKITENIASAIEMGAKALGFLSLGNVPSSGAAWASAAQHSAAAVAWGALAGGAGAGRSAVTGGRGAVPTATRDAGLGTAERAERDKTGMVINIDPFNPANPVHVRQIGRGMELDVRLSGTPAWVK